MKKDKRKLTVILSILITICMGVSYAFWKTITYQEETTDIFSSCFNLSMTEALNSNIMLENVYPISDEEGLKTKAYEFTLENTCEMPAKTSINLNVLNNTFDLNNIKVALNESNFLPPTILGDLPTLSNEDAVTKQLGEIVLFPNNPITYNFRIWLDKDVEYGEEQSKMMTSKIEVTAESYDTAIAGYEYQGKVKDLYKNHITKVGVGAYHEIDPYYGEQYIVKGTAIDNYVWYSGHLWRIVSVDESGMKLITEDIIANIAPITDFYQTSDVKKWIENRFVSALEKPEHYLKNRIWYGSKDKVQDREIKTEITETFSSNAGLITLYEFYRSINKDYWMGDKNSYLVSDNLEILSATSEKYGLIDYGTSWNTTPGYYPAKFKPAININPDIEIVDGDGTKSNPYKFYSLDLVNYENKKLNERFAGEYVWYSDYLWRIVSVENGKTKVVLQDYTGNYPLGETVDYQITSGIGKILNTNFYNTLVNPTEYLEKTAWIQPLYDWESDKTTISYEDIKSSSHPSIPLEKLAVVGYLRNDEQFSNWMNNWVMTVSNEGNTNYISNYGLQNTKDYNKLAYKIPISIVFKNSVNILNGKGTREKPFVITESAKIEVNESISDYIKSQPIISSGSGIYKETDEVFGETYIYKGGVFNNYVQYSGNLWRIVKMDSQGTVLMSQESITSIETGNTYKDGQAQKWLKEEFLPDLRNAATYLTERDWYSSDWSNNVYKDLIDRSSVGIISLLEYRKTKIETYFTYLNTDYEFTLIDSSIFPNYNSDYPWVGGTIRPCVNLRNDVMIVSGNGKINNPFLIEVEENKTGKYMNEQTSGDFVRYGNYLWRISNIEDGLTKLVMHDKLDVFDWGTKTLSYNTSNGIGKILNGEFYNYLQRELNAIEKAKWYQGIVSDEYEQNSKKALNEVPLEREVSVGLLRPDEKYCLLPLENYSNEYSHFLSISEHLPLNSTRPEYRVAVFTRTYGVSGKSYDTLSATIPSIYLKSNVKITGGTGTKLDPYTIGF